VSACRCHRAGAPESREACSCPPKSGIEWINRSPSDYLRRAREGLTLCYDCSEEIAIGLERCPHCQKCTACGFRSCSSDECRDYARSVREENERYRREFGAEGPGLAKVGSPSAEHTRRAS
jgi:hypothetical protein